MGEDDSENVRVDFRLRDTELGWMRRVDKYILLFVPTWFNILGWVTLLGALEFLRRESGSVLLGVLVGFSTVMIWRYLVAIFERIEFVGLVPSTSPRTQFLISTFISSAITVSGFILISRVIDLLGQIGQR